MSTTAAVSSNNSSAAGVNGGDVTFADVLRARERIKKRVRETPLISRRNTLTAMSNFKELYWKCEAMQKTGAFKYRGATNAVLAELEDRRKQNSASSSSSFSSCSPIIFCSHSSGNHGAALARAAKEAGCECHIVCPKNAPIEKQDAMKALGAQLHLCEPILEARETGIKKILEEFGDRAVFIHPFEHPRVIAGQGTAGIELIHQFRAANGGGDPDVVIIPVGGGGLCSGLALAVKEMTNRKTLVIGAEPSNANDASRSFVSGRVEKHLPGMPNTIADSLLTTTCPRTLKLMRENVDAFITVNEEEIARALILVMQRTKVVIEPGAGVSSAVALFKKEEIQQIAQSKNKNNKKVETAVCILCGGNVSFEKMTQFLAIAAAAGGGGGGGGGGKSKL